MKLKQQASGWPEYVNEHMIEVYHSFDQPCIPVQTDVNIFIACFTTSYARLKLYDLYSETM